MRLTELTSDLQALREDIAEELLAINRYEDQPAPLSDEDAKEAVNRSSRTRRSTWPGCCALLQRST